MPYKVEVVSDDNFGREIFGREIFGREKRQQKGNGDRV